MLIILHNPSVTFPATFSPRKSVNLNSVTKWQTNIWLGWWGWVTNLKNFKELKISPHYGRIPWKIFDTLGNKRCALSAQGKKKFSWAPRGGVGEKVPGAQLIRRLFSFSAPWRPGWAILRELWHATDQVKVKRKTESESWSILIGTQKSVSGVRIW